MRLKQDAFLWLLIGCAVIALALALSAEREPEGFFVAVRVAVCFASAYAAVKAYGARREVWSWLLGANTALYNPFVLVRLTRDTWSLVDMADIALLVTAATVLRTRGERAAQPSHPSLTAPQTSATPKKEYRTPSRTELTIWLVVLFLVLAGVFMSQYHAYFEGTTYTLAQSRNIGAATFGLMFWGYVIARTRRWRHPWRVAVGGFLAGLVTLFAASATGGYTRGTETNEILSSIGRFDPGLEARLRAGKGHVRLQVLLQSSLARALQQAPDTAVVTFAEARFAIIQSDAATALERCVAAFDGHSTFKLKSSEQRRLLRAVAVLYSAAAASPPPEATDADRGAAARTMVSVYRKIDPAGVLEDEEKRKALSDDERCLLYTKLMSELRSMPPKDAAAAIRAMASN